MVWPFGTRQKDGRTKTGFKYGPATINENARDLMEKSGELSDVAEPRPQKKFHKLDDEAARKKR